MRNLFLVPILLLFYSTVHAQTFLNLDFERSTSNDHARGWHQGGEGFEIFVDTTEAYTGNKSLCIKRVSDGLFGVATSTFPLEDALGKHLRYTGFIKTEGVDAGYAGLWWRVDGAGGMLAFDNLFGRGATGTTTWTKYTIELDVDTTAQGIFFGALLPGTGTAWFDGLRIELDGQAYQQVEPSIFSPTDEQIAWVREKSIPFTSVEPGTDYQDLMPLKDMIGDARIVALGEGTHGTSEFFKMKHRITEFLAREMGFTVFAIEANMPEARRVNRYVLNGEGDSKVALAGMYFWTWNTQEVLDMIEWMRTFNASREGHIEFWGFDMQTTTVAMDSVKSFVALVEPVFLDSVRQAYIVVEEAQAVIRQSQTRTDEPSAVRWQQAVQQVLQHLETNRKIYEEARDEMEVAWAIQNARIVVQAAEANISDASSRDESMAWNVDWILQHSPPDTKIVLWAHNGHVNRSGAWYKPMGKVLDEHHGDDMVVIGFAFHEGEYTAVGNQGLGTYGTSPSEPGSIEWVLHQTGYPSLILDLRQATASSPLSGWLTEEVD